ncbi:MAG: crotonase/enoyl-CoA hydratase family protein [Geminicoccaceae bacterium]
MTFETIGLFSDARGVARLVLNRPDKHNALSARMVDELDEAVTMLAGDDSIRCVVLEARGKTFCAGGDLQWMMAQIEADRATRMREARRLASMLHALNTLPRPLVARVHGDAYGGGIGLLAVCDQVIAARSCRFALTETRLGLIPATIGPYVIARMGEGPARRVFMSSAKFDAEEAWRLGLAGEIADSAALDEMVEKAVRPYLAVATGAVARAKALARSLGARIDEAVIENSVERLADAWETEEAREGIAAFLERRPPRWAQNRG